MMIREVEGVTNDYVVVEITREIKVGCLYKIQPTEAYLGIDQGTVHVTHITSLDSLVDISEDLANQADEFARTLLDILDGDSIAEQDALGEEDNRLRNQPWIVYQYSKLPQDRYVLPLQEFVEHTTHY